MLVFVNLKIVDTKLEGPRFRRAKIDFKSTEPSRQSYMYRQSSWVINVRFETNTFACLVFHGCFVASFSTYTSADFIKRVGCWANHATRRQKAAFYLFTIISWHRVHQSE
jgi:hypothetical protein